MQGWLKLSFGFLALPCIFFSFYSKNIAQVLLMHTICWPVIQLVCTHKSLLPCHHLVELTKGSRSRGYNMHKLVTELSRHRSKWGYHEDLIIGTLAAKCGYLRWTKDDPKRSKGTTHEHFFLPIRPVNGSNFCLLRLMQLELISEILIWLDPLSARYF